MLTPAPPRPLLPGHFHREEMIEHLPAGVVCLVPLGTADIEVQLLGGRIHRAGRRIARLGKNRQRLAVAHALRHHEVDLVVLVEEVSPFRVADPVPHPAM